MRPIPKDGTDLRYLHHRPGVVRLAKLIAGPAGARKLRHRALPIRFHDWALL